MSRLTEIIKRANLILANTGRWSEANLISIADVGQKLIARRVNYLTKTSILYLYNGLSLYKLPRNVLKLNRILYKGNVLPIVTREWMDSNVGKDWETHIGDEPKAIVLNFLELSNLRVYPVLFDDLETTEDSPFGVLSNGVDTPFGVVTGLQKEEPVDHIFVDEATEFVFENPVTDFILEDAVFDVLQGSPMSGQVVPNYDEIDGVFGVVTPQGFYFEKRKDNLKIYASYSPATLVEETSALEIPPRYDNALVHFVTGNALRQNEDTQSRAFAQEELQLFNDELTQLIRDTATMGTDDKQAFATNYVDAFRG